MYRECGLSLSRLPSRDGKLRRPVGVVNEAAAKPGLFGRSQHSTPGHCDFSSSLAGSLSGGETAATAPVVTLRQGIPPNSSALSRNHKGSPSSFPSLTPLCVLGEASPSTPPRSAVSPHPCPGRWSSNAQGLCHQTARGSPAHRRVPGLVPRSRTRERSCLPAVSRGAPGKRAGAVDHEVGAHLWRAERRLDSDTLAAQPRLHHGAARTCPCAPCAPLTPLVGACGASDMPATYPRADANGHSSHPPT